MKNISSETQTVHDERRKDTTWAKYCEARGINSNLLMLKATLFVMHGG